MAGDEIQRLPIPPTTLRSPGEGSRQKTPPEMGSLGALSLSLFTRRRDGLREGMGYIPLFVCHSIEILVVGHLSYRKQSTSMVIIFSAFPPSYFYVCFHLMPQQKNYYFRFSFSVIFGSHFSPLLESNN
jgi:hypothetical protein